MRSSAEGRGWGVTAVWMAGVALALAGCVADPLPIGQDFGSAGGADGGAEAGMGGVGGGVIDAAPDLDRDPVDMADADPIDMATGGTGGEPDMAPDEGMDEGVGGGEVVDPPTFDEVAVTRRGSETFFVWVDAAGQVVSIEVDDTARIIDGPNVVAVPDVRPERVVAREVDGYPWVAYGSADAPVVLFQVDLPGPSRIVLDGLFGPPMIAPAGDGVLVVARTGDGRLAWQRVTNDLEVEERVVDAFELDMPDDVAPVPAGVVLFFSEEGQCVQIDDGDWQASGTFVCPGGPEGRIVSDGQRALVTRIYRFGSDQRIGVTALYQDSGDYLISSFDLSTGTAFPNDGPERTVVGNRTVDRTPRLFASAVGPRETWDSVTSWADTSEWPFDRVRAMARRTLSGFERVGACSEGGAACTLDDDCDGGTCEGAAGSEYLVALEFRPNGRPRIRTFEVRLRSQPGNPYGIAFDPNCIPSPEVCDGLDQDCDGVDDDGRCCRGGLLIDYRWTTEAPVATVVEDGEQRYEMIIGDVEPNNAYRVMYRFAGTERWQGQTINIRQFANEPQPLNVTFNDAVNARYLLAAGGVTAMVAQQYVEGGEGDWAVFMGHPSRGPNEFPPRPVAPLGCTDVLAADTLNHRGVRDGNAAGEQFLVVCPDKIVRVYAVVGGENVEWSFADNDIPQISWATINRRGVASLDVLVGYRVAEEGLWAVRALRIGGNAGDEIEDGFLPGVLSPGRIGPTEASAPIHLHPVATRAPIQILDGRSARLAFNVVSPAGASTTEWRDVLLAPDPRRAVFSPASFRIYATGALPPDGAAEEATGWWATDVTANTGIYNLWSTEPVFKVNGPVARWYVAQGSYGNDDGSILIKNYDVVIITPTNDSGRGWRLFTRQTECEDP